MAALRGVIQGERGSASRLAHHHLHVDADTWKTFVDVELMKNGEGRICVQRGGKKVCYDINPEDKVLKVKRVG
jgi:hypothetical protein